MKARNCLQTLVAATVVSLALVPSVEAAKPVTVHCGQVITQDTTLANDLVDCPGDGLLIGADGVTLDLNGHTIDGSEPPFDDCDPDCLFSTGILSHGHDRVTIKNGAVREFFDGVEVRSGHASRVRRVTSDDQRHVGIVVADSDSVKVTENAVTDTGFIGAVVVRSHNVVIAKNTMAHNNHGQVGNSVWAIESDGLTVKRNAIEDSHWAIQITESHGEPNLIAGNKLTANDAGVALDFADNSHVTANDIVRSGLGVLVAGNDNEITANHIVGGVLNADGDDYGVVVDGGERNQVAGNDVRDSLLDGILVAAFDPARPALDNIIRRNDVRGVGVDGVAVATNGEGTVAGTLVDGNTAMFSGDDGFDVRTAATTLTRNKANRNHDLGIEAVPGVIDGGGNRASGNGNPLQCTNVFCK